MLSNHLKSWYLPLQDTMELAHQAHRYGLLHGDIENGAWAVMFAIENSVEMGKPLPVVIGECITYASQLESYSMLKQKRGLCWWWQVSCNLCGSNESAWVLSGEITNYDQELKQLKEMNDRTMLVGLGRAQMFLALLMGNYHLCADIALDVGDEAVQRLPAQTANIHVRFNAAMSGLIMAQHDNGKYKNMGIRNASIVHSWAKKGNPNCVHMDALLDAERAHLSSKTNKAIENYESAIDLANRLGFVHEQALASERYADMLFSIGWNDEGLSRLQDAIRWYGEWGAMAKVNQLETKLSCFNVTEESGSCWQ
jgi:hypothetical protein